MARVSILQENANKTPSAEGRLFVSLRSKTFPLFVPLLQFRKQNVPQLNDDTFVKLFVKTPPTKLNGVFSLITCRDY